MSLTTADVTNFVGTTLDPATWDALQAECQRRYGDAWQWATYQTERGIHITRLTVRPMAANGIQQFRSAQTGASPVSAIHPSLQTMKPLSSGQSVKAHTRATTKPSKPFAAMAAMAAHYPKPYQWAIWLRTVGRKLQAW